MTRQGTPGGSVLVHHAIRRICTIAMTCLCHCTLWSHIYRHHTIVWLLELWIQCCLSELLSLQPIGEYLSRAGVPVYARTEEVVGPTSFLFLEGWGVDYGSNLLVLWCEIHGWAYKWGILACLYLFIVKLEMPWCCVPRLSPFIAVWIPVENGHGCPIPDRSCARQSNLLLRVYGVRGDHLVSGVCWTNEVWIWCGWSINMRSWRAPPSVGCQW